MPKINISRSIHVQAPVEKVFAVLSNFNHWQPWSPWLVMEPDAKVQISGDAKSYQWQGKRVGEGNMHILSEQKNKQIDYSLNFVKPWKSIAKVSFSLIQSENGINVCWTMNSALPFFLFWMKNTLVAYLGMDYERGLKMLKDVIETGSVPSKLVFKGVSELSPKQYIGIKTQCTTEGIGAAMVANFKTLRAFMEKNIEIQDGAPFSVYHKWDLVKNVAEYTAAFPVSRLPNTLPSEMSVGNIPSTRVYTIRHIGSYEHIGNAWSTLYNMQQNKEIKCKTSINPLEVYENSPFDTAPEQLITDIHFPIK